MYPVCHKYEILDVFLNLKKIMETHTTKKIKWVRLDNSTEYKMDLFMKLCWDEGFVRHFIEINIAI